MFLQFPGVLLSQQYAAGVETVRPDPLAGVVLMRLIANFGSVPSGIEKEKIQITSNTELKPLEGYKDFGERLSLGRAHTSLAYADSAPSCDGCCLLAVFP